MIPEVDTLIVGGGQSGLALAYELGRRGQDPVVVERNDGIGHSWRRRWDSLRLFTPAEHDSLPGLSFPAPRRTLPTKDQVAEYLAEYASRLPRPVQTGEEVTAVERTDGAFLVRTTRGAYVSRSVVMATGACAVPRQPEFAARLDSSIQQIHSGDYRNPDSVRGKDVVVVGAGASGAEIAFELAADRRVRIAGRPTAHVPDPLLRHAGDAYWFFVHRVLTRRTPIGRKAAGTFHRRGAPLIGIAMADLRKRGVTQVPRVSGAAEGGLRLDDGSVIRPDAVVWATGFRPDLRPFPMIEAEDGGVPLGVVRGVPSLYTLGLPFQYGLTSALLGGVGRDAAALADRIAG